MVSVCVDGACLDQVSKLRYLGCILDESDTDVAECCSKVTGGRKTAGAIRSLFSDRLCESAS